MEVSERQRENINKAKRNFYKRNKDDKEYKEHRKYINLRSYSRNFIKKYSTVQDLSELRNLISERERNLKDNN